LSQGEQDYLSFRDSVIVALADAQEPPGLGDLEIQDVCSRHSIWTCDTWLMTVGKDMEQLGWGKDTSTMKSRRFLISGAGLARAAEVRKLRQSATFVERCKAVIRKDWIAILALIVSALALLRGQ
jgi:hypothetical protein